MAEDSQGSQKSKLKYKKTPGFADIAGQLYEIKMSALLFTRSLEKYSRVDVASNVAPAKPFDDVLLKVGDTPIFMQLKHYKEKQFNINYLTQPTSVFNLVECYKGYCVIKKAWKDKENQDLKMCFPLENAMFVLYTNAKYRHGISSSLDNGWQMILNTADAGKYFGVSEQETILEMFENLSAIWTKLTPCPLDVNKSKTPEAVVQMISAMSIQDIEHLYNNIAELDKMGELTNYKEFLSKVWVFTDQAKEKHLDGIIQQELGKLLGASDEHLAKDFLEKIQNWWRDDKGYVITEDSALWKQIMQRRVGRHTDSTVKELASIPLKFNENELLSFRDILLSHDARRLKIINASPAILLALKVHQCLEIETQLLIDVTKLCENQEEVLVLWRRWSKVLVLMITGENDKWKIEPLLEILENIPGKMLVLLGHPSDQKMSYLQSRKRICHLIEHKFSMKQLDLESYAKVQGLTVNLQGHDVPIRDITHIEHLPGEILMQFLSNKKLALGSCLEQIIDHFIPRSLKRWDVIDNKIFFSNTVDCFIVGNTTELQKLIPEGKKICIYGQDAINDKCRFIQVDEHFTESDFERICAINENKNVHWLNIDVNNKIVWKKSKRDITLIAQHLQDCTLYNSSDNIEDRLVITAAEPGMGKTVLFSSIARHLKDLQASTWIISVILNNHTDYLGQMDSTAIGLLEISAGIKTALEREMFHNCLQFTNKVVVLLDGFDEIGPDFCDKVLGFVKDLLSETKLKQIWISSRPTMKQMLQVKLSSLVFELVPFSRTEQKLFLEKYWKDSEVEKFINELLDIVAMNMNDHLGTFTGIPLQLQMLGDVFEEDMRNYRVTNKINVPRTLDLLELYNRFVKTKWNIYFRDKAKADMSNQAQIQMDKMQWPMFIYQHKVCALSMLLTEYEFSLLPGAEVMKASINYFIERLQSGEEKTGIITDYVNGQLIFIHRTFQEYFAALWLSENFRGLPRHIREDKIVDDKFKTTMNFFYRMLAQDYNLHIAVMNGNLKLVKDLLKENLELIHVRDKGGCIALHASVITCSGRAEDESCYKILEVLLNAGADANECDEVVSWRPLRYADGLGSWKVVGILLQRGEDSRDLISANSIVSHKDKIELPLTIAVREGFIELLQFFISKGINIEEDFVLIYLYKFNLKVSSHVTLLQASSFWGQCDIVNLLLKSGARVETRCDHPSPATMLLPPSLSRYSGETGLVQIFSTKR